MNTSEKSLLAVIWYWPSTAKWQVTAALVSNSWWKEEGKGREEEEGVSNSTV